jgi:RimJ/RimL family protein N-acetyltransferase
MASLQNPMYLRLPQSVFILDQITLKVISNENIEQIRTWRNRQLHVLRQSKEISKSEQVEYFEKFVFSEYLKNEPSQILFEIYSSSNFIGYGGLVHIDWHVSRAEISFLLDPDIEEGGSEYLRIFDHFLKLTQEVAFNNLELNRLFTETFQFRRKHINVIEGNKFTLEGTLRDHCIQNGKLANSLIHGKLRSERS